MNYFLKMVLGIVMCLTLIYPPVKSQTQPIVDDIQILEPVSGPVPMYEKVEIGLDLDLSFEESIDFYDELDFLQVVLYDPFGKPKLLLPFYYKEFRDNSQTNFNQAPSGCDANRFPCSVDESSGSRWESLSTNFPWRVRFSLDKPGDWSLQIFSLQNGTWQADGPSLLITCTTGSNKGSLQFNDHNQYLVFSNGESFFPIGETFEYIGNTSCMRSPDTSPEDYLPNFLCSYQTWLDELASSGGNFLKILLAPWQMDLEWEQVGNYDSYQNRAWDLDRLLEDCEERGVFVQISAFSTTSPSPCDNGNTFGGYIWDENPYNAIAGVEDLEDFYTNTEAKEFAKRKLRYILSRWGYSPNFMALQIMAEYDKFGSCHGNFYTQNSDLIEDWLIEMAEYIDDLEPNILVTTGAARRYGGDRLWESNAFDFISMHTYQRLKNYDHFLNYVIQERSGEFDKPCQIGEFDFRPVKTDGLEEDMQCYIGGFARQSVLHNALWSVALSGSFQSVTAYSSSGVVHNIWMDVPTFHHFEPINHFFDQENLGETYWTPLANACECTFAPSFDGHNTIKDHCYPKDYNGNVKEEYKIQGIETTDEDNIAAFAIRGDNRVLGWVHNKNHYWFGLDHLATWWDPNTGQSTSEGCEEINWISDGGNEDYAGPDPNTNSIEGQTMTINLGEYWCGGEYRVEWWSTWPEHDYNEDGNLQGGLGIIDELTTTITVGSQFATVPIPELIGMQSLEANSGNAPDYGFKIMPIYVNPTGGVPLDLGPESICLFTSHVFDAFVQGATAYQWEVLPLNGSPANGLDILTDDVAYPYVTANAVGSYNLRVTITYCEEEFVTTHLVQVTTSNCDSGGELLVSPESDFISFEIYPNPTKGFVNVEINNLPKKEERLSLQLYHINGQILKEQSYRVEDSFLNLNFDLNGFPEGVYILKLKGDTITESTLLIKQN